MSVPKVLSPSPAPVPALPVPLGLEDDPDGARIVAEEQRLLATVLRALQDAEAAQSTAAQGRELDDSRLLELREEVATAKPEDLPALFEQMHHLGALRAQRGRGAVGSVDRASPYFGHLRLEENGKRRDVLIGSKSYLDSAAGIRIVDWRHAPVSRIYYRYQQDEDYEETLGDRAVEGVVLARRSVAIVEGQLARVAAPEGTWTRGREGRWVRVAAKSSTLRTEKRWAKEKGLAPEGGPKRLGVGADGQMRVDKTLPAIASLLDSKQYDLIARPGAGLVAIQGSAGSGKTTVGLHRVAYLAFSEPTRFRPERMMVVVPHEALVHYVARVLPSLDVNGVAVTTFERFARRLVLTAFPKLPSTQSDETPPVVSRAKSHPVMLKAIDTLVANIVKAMDHHVAQSMAKWPQGGIVKEAWAATAGVDPVSGLALAPDLRVSALAQWAAGKRELPRVAKASSLPDVTTSALDVLGRELRQRARTVLATWDELLTSRPLLEKAFEGLQGFGPGQLAQVHEWCLRQARIRQEADRDGEAATLDAEDDALLLRLWQKLRGPLVDHEEKPLRFAHMFIDEVQDANPVALRVLLETTTKERSITLAGDVAQRMDEEGNERGEFSWDHLLDDLGVPHTKMEPLQVSYRSTAEITSFARAVLGPYAHEAEPIASRNGPPVELFGFASTGEAVAFLADALKQLQREEPYANVALVARFAPQAEVYFEGLERAEVPNVRRVREQNFDWSPGIDVTDVRQTKGLEFDEVVLLDTNQSSYPSTAPARHALYVGATRAAHQLWCIASDKPAEIVEQALESVQG